MEDTLFRIISALIDGLTIGSVYALMAIGLSLVFGVTRAYNFAHGSFFTWGAYLVWVIPFALGIADVSYWAIFALVIPIMFLVGWVFDKLVVSPLRKSANWMTTVMITTLGSAIILDNTALVSFGPLTKSIPPLFNGTLELGSFVIGINDLAVFIVSILIMVLLSLFLGRTREGRAITAVAQDIVGARMVGISADKVFGITFGLSAILSATAGILLAPKYFVSPMGGWAPFIKSFVIVFFGGLGSFKGTFFAAFTLGIVEAMVSLFLAPVWIMPAWFVVLIGILIIRPKGLFGKWS